jgi:hypothetical protein
MGNAPKSENGAPFWTFATDWEFMTGWSSGMKLCERLEDRL